MSRLAITRLNDIYSGFAQIEVGVTESFEFGENLVATDDSIQLTVVRLDGGSGSVLTSCGVPLQEGQLDPANVDDVSLWLNTGSGMVEVGCYVEVLADRPTDGSAWSVLVQWTGDPDDITAAELRLTGTPGESRLSKTTPPGEPDAMFIPTSATHLRDCDIFPYPITLAADIDTDYSDYGTMFSDAYLYAMGTSSWPAQGIRGKYAGAAACYLWVFMNGPAVSDVADFLNGGNDMAVNNADLLGDTPTYNDLDNTGNAVHYLLTGDQDSWTKVGKYACRLGGEAWNVQGGGRECFHTTEAVLYAYLLDIDDVSRGAYGPYTRAQHMSNLVAKVTAWDAGWDSGDAALDTPLAGFHNVDGGNSYPSDGMLAYMNSMMHTGVMRCFIKLAGESSALDALRSAWETALLNFCDYILNDLDGYDDTSGVNVWIYSARMEEPDWCGGWAEGDRYADFSHPGTTAWAFWWSGFVNTAFGYAKDAATGVQATEFTAAFRTATIDLIARLGDPGSSNQWGTYDLGGGAGYYISTNWADVVGVNGIVGMGLAHASPWLDEAS